MRIAIHLGKLTNVDKRGGNLPDLGRLKPHGPDVLLFPEQYLLYQDAEGIRGLQDMSRKTGIPVLVGIGGDQPDSGYTGQQVFLYGDPTTPHEQVYCKHTSAGNQIVGWEYEDWSAGDCVSPFEIGGHRYGVTICHDLYLGGLHRYQARQGRADVLLNSTFFKVKDEKWGTLARLRALENSLSFLVAVHADGQDRKHHPYAFDANGQEMEGVRVRDGARCRPHEMFGEGQTFVFEIPNHKPLPRRQALLALPDTEKNIRPNVPRERSIQVKIQGGQLVPEKSSDQIEIVRIDGMGILDIARFFKPLEAAWQTGKTVIFWNRWDPLDIPATKLVHIMLGRTLEFCSPVVLTDGNRIHEITELATDTKVLRRCSPGTTRAWVDLHRAFGLRSSFEKIVTNHLGAKDAKALLVSALENYRTLFD